MPDDQIQAPSVQDQTTTANDAITSDFKVPSTDDIDAQDNVKSVHIPTTGEIDAQEKSLRKANPLAMMALDIAGVPNGDISGRLSKLYGVATSILDTPINAVTGAIKGAVAGVGAAWQPMATEEASWSPESAELLKKYGLLEKYNQTWVDDLSNFKNGVSVPALMNLAKDFTMAPVRGIVKAVPAANQALISALSTPLAAAGGAAGSVLGKMNLGGVYPSSEEEGIKQGVNTGLGMFEATMNEAGLHAQHAANAFVQSGIADTRVALARANLDAFRDALENGQTPPPPIVPKTAQELNLPSITSDEAVSRANKRFDTLNNRTITPEGVGGLDENGKPIVAPKPLTYAETLEHKFLSENKDDPAALARAYPYHITDGPMTVEKAHDLGAIGDAENEVGFAASGHSTVIEEQTKAADRRMSIATGQPMTEEETNIHELARSIDPDTVGAFEALQTRRDALGAVINRAASDARDRASANAPHGEEIQAAEAKLHDLNTQLEGLQSARDGYQTGGGNYQKGPQFRKLNVQIREMNAQISDAQGNLDGLTKARNDFIESAAQGAGINPAVAALRDQMQKLDYQMRDLAPALSEAYRKAREQSPEAPKEVAHIEQAEVKNEPSNIEGEEPKAAVQSEQEGAPPPAEPTRSITTPEHIDAIREEVRKRLADAGHPDNVNQAIAELVASHYHATAEAFDGAKGNALDIFNSEFPSVVGKEKGGPKGLAQGALNAAKSVVTLFKSADASTFMHEMGHKWLDELLTNAEAERATDQMKSDAKTIRDWVGAKEGQKLTRGMEEKFARAMERHLYDGQAPTKGLVRVFAQFRQWLSDIHDKVKGLVPISDDIKDVFDRLIAPNPERQPVGKIEPIEKVLADLHEADAEHTPPEQMKHVADIAEPEILRSIADKFPEAEIENAGTGRPREGAENTGGNGGPSAEAGPHGGAGNRRPEFAEVGKGAGENATEGARPRAEPNAGPEPEPSELRGFVPEPRTEPPAATPEYELGSIPNAVDKAGNIRPELITDARSLDMVLHTAAEQMRGFVDERRGVLPDQKVIELCDLLGLNLDELDMSKFGTMMLPEKVEALKRLIIQSAEDVQAKAKAVNDSIDINTGLADPAAIKALQESFARHNLIQGRFSSVNAEWGRIGRVLNRRIPGSETAKALKDVAAGATDEMTLYQMQRMAKMVGSMDTTADLSRLTRDSLDKNWQNFIIEYYIHNLISGPITHAKYAIHNNLLLLSRIPETLAAGAVAGVTGAEAGNRVYMGQAGAMGVGYATSLWPGVRAAFKSLVSGALYALPGEEEALHMSANGGELPPTATMTGMLPSRPGVIPGVAGDIIRAPARVVQAVHAFTRVVGYSVEAHSEAYRMARDSGIDADNLGAISAHMASTLSKPTPEFMLHCREEANRLALMEPQKYDGIAAAINKVANQNLAFKLVQPFVNIQSNILKQSYLERTPVGLLTKERRDIAMGVPDEAGNVDKIAQQQLIGKMIVGSTIGAFAAMGVAGGNITGGGPADYKERAIWIAQGNQPYSIRIGDNWISYRGGPIGTIMGSFADTAEIIKQSENDDTSAQIAKSLVAGVGKNILDESNIRGFHDAIDAALNPKTLGDRYIRNMAGSFIPYSVGLGQIARATDTMTRHQETYGEMVKAHIPGMIESLTPNYDVFGNTIPVTGLPGIFTHAQSNVMADEMAKVGFFPSVPRKQMDGVDLTESQYADFKRISGRFFAMRLEANMDNPGWSDVPPQIKAEMMSKMLTSSRKMASIQLKIENPDLVESVARQKEQDIKDRFAR